MKKTKRLLSTVLGAILGRFEPRRPRGSVALANAVALMFEHGRESLTVDPTNTLPATSKYLGYMRGSTQYYAKTWDGGSGASSFPLGISPDAPYQTGDTMTVERLGAMKGTMQGISAGAITIDHLVGAAASGLVVDLQAAITTYTAWVIGRAAATVSAASQEIAFIPCAPYLITTTSGTLTNPTNPL